MKNKILKVYDTITGKMVDVEVTPEVYREYMRTEWCIKKKDKSFYDHEIQFSALVGGNDGAYENFDEFIQDDDYEDDIINKIYLERLPGVMKQLSKDDRELIDLMFYKNMSEEQIAEMKGVTQQNISQKRQRILGRCYKLLKSE